MNKKYITKELELFDVLSAFPNLKDVLITQKINVEKMIEGESIEEFLQKLNMDKKEIDIFIKKITLDLNNFLYNENLKSSEINEETIELSLISKDESEILQEEE